MLPRFYCPFPLSTQTCIELPATIAHHAVRVLRLRAGDKLVVFDGTGGEYPGVLHLNGHTCAVQLGTHHRREAELSGTITLVQGLAVGDKMDWIVEKCAELGVHTLVPIAAQRSVRRLNPERQLKQLAHWHRIAISASEQCGRNRIMHIAPLVSLDDYLSQITPGNLCLLCHPEQPIPLDQALHSLDKPPHAITLMIGPEGGWTPAEQALAQARGAMTVGFGPRILRTETAGLALVAATIALLGWLSG